MWDGSQSNELDQVSETATTEEQIDEESTTPESVGSTTRPVAAASTIDESTYHSTSTSNSPEATTPSSQADTSFLGTVDDNFTKSPDLIILPQLHNTLDQCPATHP